MGGLSVAVGGSSGGMLGAYRSCGSVYLLPRDLIFDLSSIDFCFRLFVVPSIAIERG